MSEPRPELAVVIPVYNERENLPLLGGELRPVLDALATSYEVFLVDDGSTDGSQDVLAELARPWPQCRVLRLRRNFGKSAALEAGLAAARGELLVTLDGDGQDDPADLPRLIERLKEGAHFVCAHRRPRRDGWSKRLQSWLFNVTARLLCHVTLHDLNSGLRAFTRAVYDTCPIYDELFRFLPILAVWSGFRVEEMTVHHRPRRYGRSSYGWRRLTSSVWGLVTVLFLTRFHKRPTAFFGKWGLLMLLAGLGICAFIAYLRLSTGSIEARFPLLALGGLLILVGVQMVSVGLLGELIVFRDWSERGKSAPALGAPPPAAIRPPPPDEQPR